MIYFEVEVEVAHADHARLAVFTRRWNHLNREFQQAVQIARANLHGSCTLDHRICTGLQRALAGHTVHIDQRCWTGTLAANRGLSPDEARASASCLRPQHGHPLF